MNTQRKNFPPQSVIYMDLSGNPIENPHPLIVKLNAPQVAALMQYCELLNQTINKKSQPVSPEDEAKLASLRNNLKKGPQNKVDFQTLDTNAKMYAVSLWNEANIQADRTRFGMLDELQGCSAIDIETSLRKITMTMQDIIKILGMHIFQGATFCSSVFNNNEVCTINIGDNVSYLLKFNKPHVQLTQLNPKLHRLTEPEVLRDPKLRKHTIGNYVSYGKLDYHHFSLPVSRTLGSTLFSNSGVSEASDFHQDKIERLPADRVFIINATSSVSKKFTAEELQSFLTFLFAENPEMSPPEIANNIAQEVITRGCSDNISITISELFPHESSARYTAVFHGYNGDSVSHALAEIYEVVLQNELLFTKLNKTHPELTLKLREIFQKGLKLNDLEEIKQFIIFFNRAILSALLAIPEMDLKNHYNDIIANAGELTKFKRYSFLTIKSLQSCINYCGEHKQDFLSLPVIEIENTINQLCLTLSLNVTTLRQLREKTLNVDPDLQQLYIGANYLLTHLHTKIPNVEVILKDAFNKNLAPDVMLKHLIDALEQEKTKDRTGTVTANHQHPFTKEINQALTFLTKLSSRIKKVELVSK